MRISIIITSYNQKCYLREAIESVLTQTLPPYEIIIVDDCSSDSSRDMILDYASRYPQLIRAFCHKEGLGIPKNRNYALRQAHGDLISFLDGDDRFLPEKLELELNTLQQHPEAKLVFSNIYYIDEIGQRTGVWAESDQPPTGYVLKEAFSRSWPKGILYRNELINLDALNQIGLYDEELQIYEDWDLKIRFTSKFKVAYCDTPLAEYRQHPEGISKKSTMEFHFETIRKIYGKNRHLLENLSENDRGEVESTLLTRIRRLEAWSAVEKGQRFKAFKTYLTLAMENPFKPAGWIILLKFLLTVNTHEPIIKRSARTRKNK